MKTAVIVLGGDVNGLGVIRSVGRLGACCGLIHTGGLGEHAHRSKYLTAAHQVSIDITDDQLHAQLDILRDRLGSSETVLIATSDRFSQFLSANKIALSKRFLLNCCDIELCNAFLDKWRTAEMCATHNVLTPSTICPDSRNQLHLQAKSLRFPLIVKPRYTFDSRFPGKNAFISEYDELLDFFVRHDVLGHSVIQEIIPSGDGDIIVLASYSDSDGKVIAMYSGRKLRQFLPDYGATCFGVSEKQPELELQTTEFLNAIGYRGFAMIEFARSRLDGRYYFLELNTRTSWTNQLFVDSGVDLSKIGFLEMTNRGHGYKCEPAVQQDGVVFLDFRRDLASMRIKRRQGDIRLVTWLHSLFEARSFAFWDKRDVMPFFAACGYRIRTTCRKFLSLVTIKPSSD